MALIIILAAVIYYIQRTRRRLAETRAALEIEKSIAINAEYLAVLDQQLEERNIQKDSLGPEQRTEQLRLSMDIIDLESSIRDMRREIANQELQQQSAVSRRLLFRALAVAIVVLVAIFVLRSYCMSKAEDVKNGDAVAPAAVLGLTVLAIEAIPAIIQPIGDAKNSPILSDLAGKRLLYLGRADGNLVLYQEGKGALHVPASSVVLTVTNDSSH
jgi:Ca2+/Na+ antiporter